MCDLDQLLLKQDRMSKQKVFMVKGTHEDNTENKIVWKMEDRKVSSTVLKVQRYLII